MKLKNHVFKFLVKEGNTINKMQFKIKLLELIDALLLLFEDKNKILYRRLISYHHQVKNVISNDNLHAIIIKFLSNEYIEEKIKKKDNRFLCNTPLETDVDLLWESCTSENKAVIWRWINVIIECVENEQIINDRAQPVLILIDEK